MAALTEEMSQLAERFEKAIRHHEFHAEHAVDSDDTSVQTEYEEAKAELLSALSWVP